MSLRDSNRFGPLLLIAAISLAFGLGYIAIPDGDLRDDTARRIIPADVRVLEVTEGTVRLFPLFDAAGGPWKLDGIYGLQWEDGYGQVGRVLEVQRNSVLREFTPVWGTLEVGDKAFVDPFAYEGDPRSAIGLEYKEITLQSEQGKGPAWYLPGIGKTWVIVVHGNNGTRLESLRVLSSLRELQMPMLVPTYRSDVEFTSDYPYTYGETEWRNILPALDYARKQGAERFFLIGYSSAGGIILNLLQQFEYAPQIAGIVLDGPLLDWKRTIQFTLPGAPTSLVNLALLLQSRNSAIDWLRTEYLSAAASLTTPTLILHGDADRRVPLRTSQMLAEARPDLVKLRILPGVDHVQGWNRDREGYGAVIREFITNLNR